MNEEKVPGLVRALDDREIRLNCVLLAVSATTYMRGRLTDPLTVAEEFYAWVTEGKKPEPGRVQFGTQAPARVEEGYLSGGAAPTAEALRSDGPGDLIDVPPPRASRARG